MEPTHPLPQKVNAGKDQGYPFSRILPWIALVIGLLVLVWAIVRKVNGPDTPVPNPGMGSSAPVRMVRWSASRNAHFFCATISPNGEKQDDPVVATPQRSRIPVPSYRLKALRQ
jgi:hypothetical protein